MTVLSLFDYSGTWSRPFRQVAHVVQVDIKHGINIMSWDYRQHKNVVGILAAPPCTDFAVSGAQYWPEKDKDGRTAQSIALVRKVLEIVEYHQPRFWALENPAGRIEKCVPELRGKRMLSFHPCDFGDPYTKRTILWGYFNPFLVRRPVTPERVCSQGSWLQKLGGKSEKTKELRSVTPTGFAQAFFEAQKIYFRQKNNII
ncbi:MAG: DNA cytosine methyltransferase [Sinomicrobium sp.]|nr:DNA cytosine methyltransferase [Sinomicrobium sp.]